MLLDGAGNIRIEAGTQAAQVLLGTATMHAHDLVLGSSSVHTSAAALQQAQQRIREIGVALRHNRR